MSTKTLSLVVPAITAARAPHSRPALDLDLTVETKWDMAGCHCGATFGACTKNSMLGEESLLLLSRVQRIPGQRKRLILAWNGPRREAGRRAERKYRGPSVQFTAAQGGVGHTSEQVNIWVFLLATAKMEDIG